MKPGWRRFLARVLLGSLLLMMPLSVSAAVDTSVLEDALTQDAQEALEGISPENTDLADGIAGLWNQVRKSLGGYVREALGVGVFMFGACMLLAMAAGFSNEAGISIPAKLPDFTAVAVLLTIYLSAGSSLINECARAISQLDSFIKIMTPVYAAASAVAGRPVSAVAVGEITLLFSAVVLWLCSYLILPGISLYVLMDAIGSLVPTGMLGKLAELLRWGIGKSMKWVLTGFTAYQTLSGMITRSADAFAVKTAQTALSSMIPVVGTLISGTSETILGGANLLRTSVGVYGFLSVCAICLGPLVRAAAHFFIFKLLTAFGGAYLGGAASHTIGCITNGYGMAVGALGMCCLVEFISIVVSTLVTAS